MSAAAFKRVGVFCGANNGVSPAFAQAAQTVGATLAARDIQLVYGGSSLGLMGIVADAALANGGIAIGVIPQPLMGKEIAHSKLTELHIVDSMHARKQKMAELSDAFIAMPGGFGTLDESFEILTWTQLGIHAKPLGLLNVDGFYDHLIRFNDHQAEQGFVKKPHRDMLLADNSASALLDRLAALTLPSDGKWIKP